jgi:vitamin B12 transporter
MFRNKITAFLLVLLSILSLATSVSAISEENMKKLMQMSEQERKFLLMYFDEEDLFVISATRSLKSITRVAENVEVVTAEDIELMNAHTLPDVLNTINGVQVGFSGAAPGMAATAQIQGSRIDHVVMLIDGVSVSYISTGNPPIDIIPVQMIEKIEVIKGPASSSWGSSLGGIINIITKSSAKSGKISGMVSGSYGEANTVDARAELSGRTGGFGYNVSAGTLYSNGLRPHDSNRHNNIFSKFSYDFSKDSSASLMLFYTKADEAMGIDELYRSKYDSKGELFVSSLTVKSRISDELSFELQGRTVSNLAYGFTTDLDSGEVFKGKTDDKKYGGSLKLDFRKGIHAVIFGADYDFLNTEFSGMSFDEYIAAAYINDTITFGNLSVTPGLRFDHVDVKDTSLQTDFISPSLGVTYRIAENTILRGVVARGFNIPGVFNLTSDSEFFVANTELELEEVWSYQAGVETGALKYLWLKAGVFRHDVTDAITYEDVSVDEGTWTFVNKDKVRRQGFEVEARTLPFYNITLTAATCYMETEDRNTGETLKDNPTNTYDFSIKYDDNKALRALVKGRYIWWNASQNMNARYNSMIVDANIIKTVYKRQAVSVEAFLSGHNLFNGSSYWLDVNKNASRWFEAGLRVKF